MSPPENLTSDSSRVTLLVGFAIALIVLSTLAVFVRFWSRVVMPGVWIWWDDWAVFATMIFANLTCGFIIWATHYGLGQHMHKVPRSDATMSNIIQLVTQICYGTATNMLKISALVLYARIFRVSRPFRIVLWTTGMIITIWWILLVVLPFTHCNPPKKAFFPEIKGHCSGYGTPWYLGSSITNVGFDLIVLVLPMPMVWRLQLKLAKKIQVLLIFMLGYSSAFVGLARFGIVAHDPAMLNDSTDKDLTYNLVPLLLLSMIEPPLGIVALCGPSIRHIVMRGTSDGFKSLWIGRDSRQRLLGNTSYRTGTGASDGQTSGRSGNKSKTSSTKVFGLRDKNAISNSSAEITMDHIPLTGENKV